MTTTTIGGTISPLAAAQARAATDKDFAAVLAQVGKAAAILGAGTHTQAAGKVFAELANAIAAPCVVILGWRKQGDGDDTDKKLPTLEAAPALLLELCGAVNHAIGEAQTEARRAAIRRLKGDELQKAAKKARGAIVERMRRAMLAFGVSVNFQAATCEATEEKAVKTDKEKAAERVVSGFALDLRGALAGLDALDAQQWAFVVSFVARTDLERQAEAAAESARGLREAATKIAENVKSMRGKSDLVSLANAEREAAAADKRAKEAQAAADKLTKALKAA